jgi:hypothetical protein
MVNAIDRESGSEGKSFIFNNDHHEDCGSEDWPKLA